MATGLKTGGRTKGTPNRATAARASEIAAAGLTPLDYMLGILRDESKDAAERFEAAKQAAPYCHPKLAATTLDLGADTIDALAEIIAQRRQRVAEADHGE
jgi:hypothetical protein